MSLLNFDTDSDSKNLIIWVSVPRPIPRLLMHEFRYRVRFRGETHTESLGVSVPSRENREALLCTQRNVISEIIWTRCSLWIWELWGRWKLNQKNDSLCSYTDETNFATPGPRTVRSIGNNKGTPFPTKINAEEKSEDDEAEEEERRDQLMPMTPITASQSKIRSARRTPRLGESRGNRDPKENTY